MYGLYDYGVVTQTDTYTHNLPHEICDIGKKTLPDNITVYCIEKCIT